MCRRRGGGGTFFVWVYVDVDGRGKVHTRNAICKKSVEATIESEHILQHFSVEDKKVKR